MFNVKGMEISFEHIRAKDFSKYISDEKMLEQFQQKYRAITQCTIDANDIRISQGRSYCLQEDNFDKAFGRKLALTRALKFAGDWAKKPTRKLIWEKYFSMVKR